ncbi:hypothetical protein ACFX2G_043673 [Malus domestica]
MPFDSADAQMRQSATTRVQHSLGHPPPQQTEPLHCPRCDSDNTKFCYYNNYNLAQPRHFCKSCRRYWTHGGTLRNVPVGGGSRKNTKRSRPSCSSSSGSPSSSSLTQEVSSVAPTKPISFPVEPKLETALDHDKLMDLNESTVGNGGFTSMLSSQGPPAPGFLALGGFGYGFGYGLGLGQGLDEVGTFGYGGGRGVLAFPEEGDFANINHNNSGAVSGGSVGCNTWQIMTGGDGGMAENNGDCFTWPELEISK